VCISRVRRSCGPEENKTEPRFVGGRGEKNVPEILGSVRVTWKQVLCSGATNIKLYRTKLIRPGDLAADVCPLRSVI
jgi:hypothetical protein